MIKWIKKELVICTNHSEGRQFGQARNEPQCAVPGGVAEDVGGEVLREGLLTMTKVLQLSGLLLQGLFDLVGRALLKGHLDEKTFLFIRHAVVEVLQELAAHE